MIVFATKYSNAIHNFYVLSHNFYVLSHVSMILFAIAYSNATNKFSTDLCNPKNMHILSHPICDFQDHVNVVETKLLKQKENIYCMSMEKGGCG